MGMIFISHSSRNNAEAIGVRDWLVSNGWGPAQIFLDLDALGGGERWRQRLDEIGNNCEAVIVCLSDDWIRSPECAREFTHAEARGKPIFPIIVAPLTVKIPSFVSDIQFVNISDPTLAEGGFEKLKLGLKRAQIGPNHFGWPPPSDPARPPYRGLRSFEEDDAAIFFGRDAQITAGLDALRQIRGGDPHRILTIAAASGAGKSSFLKAGLLARLRRDEENFLILPTWRPGRDALGGETGLLKSLGLETPGRVVPALAAMQAAVIKRMQTFGVPGAGERPPPSLVLPLDQAEELFSAENSSALAAVDLLVQTLAEKPDLLVIATIRSDSLGGLQADARIAGQLNLFNLPALPPSAFKEVIEGPAALTRPPIRIEPALTDQLIADLDKADALPLLAFTLERLVADYGGDNLLELREYQSGLGGVSGAINAAVEAAMLCAAADPALPDTRHELDTLARAAFIPWLVQLEEAEASPKRRVAKLCDIPPASTALIEHFVEERLLVAASAGGESVIEVSHEAVLRHWRGLAAWISEERTALERLQRVQRASMEWVLWGDYRTNKSELLVHRGERLIRAEELLERKDLAKILGDDGIGYIKACREAEDNSIARDKAQLDREMRQRRRASRWQSAAAMILCLGFAALAFGGLFLIQERRTFGMAQSLMLARAGEQLRMDHDPARALVLSILANRETALTPVVPEAHEALLSSLDALKQRVAVKHEGPVRGAMFSKDGEHILSWSDDNTARLWDASSGLQALRSISHEGSVLGASFSPDQAYILTWSEDFTARLWDRATGGQIVPAFQHSAPVLGAIFSSDGLRILTWSEDATARLWDVPTGRQIGPGLEHMGPVNGAVFSEDESRILTWSADGSARLWSADTATQIGPDLRHDSSDPEITEDVRGAIFSQDQNRILSWSVDHESFSGSVRLWDTLTGAQIGDHFSKAFGGVLGATFLRDDTEVLYWFLDGYVEHRDIKLGVDSRARSSTEI
jgi:hypothetical protein